MWRNPGPLSKGHAYSCMTGSAPVHRRGCTKSLPRSLGKCPPSGPLVTTLLQHALAWKGILLVASKGCSSSSYTKGFFWINAALKLPPSLRAGCYAGMLRI
jgi:hypothetical protein